MELFLQERWWQWVHEYYCQWIKHGGKILTWLLNLWRKVNILSFFFPLRKSWLSSLLERRKDLACFYWLDPVSSWLRWDHSKRHQHILLLKKRNLECHFLMVILWFAGCCRFSKGRGQEKMDVSRAKSTAWHEEQRWKLFCSSDAKVSHLKNKIKSIKHCSE